MSLSLANPSTARKKLLTRIAALQKQAETAKKAAKLAKSVFKTAKQKFKEAKRAARKLRKDAKALKVELAALTTRKKSARKVPAKTELKRARPAAPEPVKVPAGPASAGDTPVAPAIPEVQ